MFTGVEQQTATRIEQEIIDNDQRAKGKMKSSANKRRHTKECDIKVGDKVLVEPRYNRQSWGHFKVVLIRRWSF